MSSNSRPAGERGERQHHQMNTIRFYEKQYFLKGEKNNYPNDTHGKKICSRNALQFGWKNPNTYNQPTGEIDFTHFLESNSKKKTTRKKINIFIGNNFLRKTY